MSRTQRDGLLLILVSAAGYSFLSVFTKWVYASGFDDPLDVLIWRFIIAAPAMWGGLWLSRRRGTPARSAALPWRWLLAMGVLFGVVALAAFQALARLPASLYTVLIYTYPAMVALGALLFGERLPARSWAALGLMFVGVALTVPNFAASFEGAEPLGVALALANAALYAAYILLSSRLLRGAGGGAQAGAWSITGSLLFCLVIAAARGLQMPAAPVAWAGLLGVAVISTAVPVFTFYAGMSRLGPAQASLLSTVEPVMTLTWAALLLGELLLPAQLVGAACVLGALVLLQLRPGRRLAAQGEQS